MAIPSLRVLFLCTGNSARSQMAEAILRQMTHGTFDVTSAGTTPEPEIHPMAVKALGKLGISVGGQYPKPLQQLLDQTFDYVITVCDRSAERCLPGDPERIHWSFEDPAAVNGSEDVRPRAFNSTASQMVNRIRIWLALPSVGGSVARER